MRGRVFLVSLLVTFAGCQKSIDNKDEVQKGIMKYLSRRSDLASMDVDVRSVSFRQNEANANVYFQAKGSAPTPGNGMLMSYVLERKGNEWVVKGKSQSGAANPHGGGMPMGSAPGADMNSLPPGHPAVPVQ